MLQTCCGTRASQRMNMYALPITPASHRLVVSWRPRQVWIERQVVDSPVTANVLSHLPDVPTAVIDGLPPVPMPPNQAALMTSAKKALYLTAQKSTVRARPEQPVVISRASCAVAT